MTQAQNEEMGLEKREERTLTPFERAGYTKDTKFKVLLKNDDLVPGEVVVLAEDDNSLCPYFTRPGLGDFVCMYLPKDGPDLEVYEEDEDKGHLPSPVTRNTKINVEMTVEEVLAIEVLTGCTVGTGTLDENIRSVFDKVDDALEEVIGNFSVSYYISMKPLKITDYIPNRSFEYMLNVLLPESQEKQNTLNEIEELRNKLAELEAKVGGGMG